MPQMKIQHVALSVTDITKSGPWYQELFGFQKVAEFARPAPMEVYMTPDGQALDLRRTPTSWRSGSPRSDPASTTSRSSVPTAPSSTYG
jgi:catechol 2,3-dioxygenase-like lactoylglutathione lyase family enzyme